MTENGLLNEILTTPRTTLKSLSEMYTVELLWSTLRILAWFPEKPFEILQKSGIPLNFEYIRSGILENLLSFLTCSGEQCWKLFAKWKIPHSTRTFFENILNSRLFLSFKMTALFTRYLWTRTYSSFSDPKPCKPISAFPSYAHCPNSHLVICFVDSEFLNGSHGSHTIGSAYEFATRHRVCQFLF